MCIDPIALILTALAAGAAASGQTFAGEAIKDSYAGLKALIQRKFAGKPKAQLALSEHESDPGTWETRLKTALAEAHVEQDQENLEAAHGVMSLLQSQQRAPGKFKW